MKGNNYFKQSKVLISRYLKIFFNDKQNLALTLAIPLLTIIIVCLVASDDMFAQKADNDINDGYPIASWEVVDYEMAEDDEEEKSEPKPWDGNVSAQLMPADSEGEKFYINSPADFQLIATAKGDLLNKTYYLNSDIDFGGKEILPVGDSNEPFTGTFEGNGHIIKNFYITKQNDCAGLFGQIGENGAVSNFGVESSHIETGSDCDSTGFIAGYIYNGTVEGCYSKNECSIVSNGENAGGIAGFVEGENSVIRNCYSRADITVDGSCAGGIAGYVCDGSLQFNYFAGNLESEGSSDYFGSIAGQIDGDFNSFNCIYDKDNSEFNAIGTDSGKGTDKKSDDIEGWKTEKLKENASLIRKQDKKISEDDKNGTFKNDGELASFSGSQTGLFMLACVAIFVGICNSIQEICKERNILKREYMTNLKLSSYMTSKLVVQGMICAVQNIIMLLIFFASVSDKVFPKSGVILPGSKIEIFVTMFLLTFASDTIALLISSIVKNSSTANTFIPIILIVQIVFSGVLFDLGDAMDKMAGIMISKWGIGALAATCRLNEARMPMLMENPELSLRMGEDMTRIKDLYYATPGNLIKIWLILVIFIAGCSLLSGFLLRRVKNDRR